MHLSTADLDRLAELPGGPRLREIYDRLLEVQTEMQLAKHLNHTEAENLAREAVGLAKDAIGIVEEHL